MRYIFPPLQSRKWCSPQAQGVLRFLPYNKACKFPFSSERNRYTLVVMGSNKNQLQGKGFLENAWLPPHLTIYLLALLSGCLSL